jgi:hypothetical protein
MLYMNLDLVVSLLLGKTTQQDTRGSPKGFHLFDLSQEVQQGHCTDWEICPFRGLLSSERKIVARSTTSTHSLATQ